MPTVEEDDDEDEGGEEKGLDQAGKEQLKEAIKTRDALKALTDSAGWRMVMALCEDQVTKRLNTLILVPCTMDNFPAQEFSKGEVAGIKMIKMVVEVKLEEAEALVENLRNARR